MLLIPTRTACIVSTFCNILKRSFVAQLCIGFIILNCEQGWSLWFERAGTRGWTGPVDLWAIRWYGSPVGETSQVFQQRDLFLRNQLCSLIPVALIFPRSLSRSGKSIEKEMAMVAVVVFLMGRCDVDKFGSMVVMLMRFTVYGITALTQTINHQHHSE